VANQMPPASKLIMRSTRGRLAAALAGAWVVLALLCGPAPAEGPAVPYRTEFVGLESTPRLEESLHAASQLVSGEGRPPATLRQLRRRIAEDLPRLRDALRSRGYYAATADAAVDTTTTPAVVTVTVAPGPAYTLGSYRVEASGGEGGPAVSLPLADLGLKLGAAAEAAPIRDADTLLLRALGEHGYPLAEVAERRVVVDHDRRVVEVTVDLGLGPAARFGETQFAGLERIDRSYAARRIAWQPGEIYDTRKVEQTRAALARSRSPAPSRLRCSQNSLPPKPSLVE
jgi:translocation and assembly module TamA